jgi:hypothetical protein
LKGVFRKIDDRTLVAASAAAMEALASVHRGQDCMADVRGARNIQQFNLFWKMMDLLAKATDCTKYAAKQWLMREMRYVDMLMLPDGAMELVPQSVAFERMTQEDFAEFFSAAIPHIATELEIAPAELVAQFESLLVPEERQHFNKIKAMAKGWTR